MSSRLRRGWRLGPIKVLRSSLRHNGPRCGGWRTWARGFLCGVSAAAAVTPWWILVLQFRRRSGGRSGAATGTGRSRVGAWPAGGVDDGSFQKLAVQALGLRTSTGGAVVFRRRGRLEAAVLRSGRLGVHPRPMCHRDMGPGGDGGEYKRSTKQLGCEEAFPDLGLVVSRLFLRWRLWRRRMQAMSFGGLPRGLQGVGCNFLFLEVLCAKCQGSWLFWAVPGAACDVLSLSAI